jgi:hypothetical protein
MPTASLVAEISTKGAKKAEKELKGVAGQAKKTEGNVVKMKNSFKGVGRQASAAAAAVNGPLGGISSRISAVTTVLTSGTAAATLFGVGIAGIGFAVAAGVAELDRMNVELAKTEAILTATGFASGKTAIALQEQAKAIALATLASTQGIQQAQAKLLTFDKIHGEVFDSAIELTQDLATVFGGDAASQATQLGKALQDPVKGLTALNRVGVSFTKQQSDQVKAMVANGDTMKAQTVIIEALKAQVGGAGAAVAGDSLAGAFDTAGQRWDEFAAALASKAGAFESTRSSIDAVSSALLFFTETLTPKNSEQLTTILNDIESKIGGLSRTAEGLTNVNLKNAVEQRIQILADSRSEILFELNQALISENSLRIEAEEAKTKSDEKIKAAELTRVVELNNAKLAAEKAYNTESIFLTEEQFTIANNSFVEQLAAEQAFLLQRKEMRMKAANDDIAFADNVFKLKEASEKQSAREQLNTLGGVTSDLATILGEQSALYKTAAISETLINTYSSATKAFNAMAGIPIIGPALGGAAAGIAVAAGLKNVRAITSVREQGGSLSAGQTSSFAERGKLEVLTPANSSRIQTANQMKQIMGQNGGGGQPQVNIVNIDQTGGGVDIQTTTNEDGRIVQLIRDTVSADTSTPNSKIDKAQTARGQLRRRG